MVDWQAAFAGVDHDGLRTHDEHDDGRNHEGWRGHEDHEEKEEIAVRLSSILVTSALDQSPVTMAFC